MELLPPVTTGVAAVGGIGEVPVPPRGGQATDEGEVRASDDLRTPMEGMEVGGYEM